MSKLRKTALIFIIILIQSALAVTAGIVALSLAAADTLPSGIYVGDANIGGMGKMEASKAIDDYFAAIFSKGSIKISILGVDYKIPYADFDVSVDSSSTVDFMDEWRSAAYIPNLIEAYFGKGRLNIHPVIKYNEGKLRQKLIELSKEINKAPVDASISIKDRMLVRKVETLGYALNVAGIAEAIGKHLSAYTDSPLKIDNKASDLIQTVDAKIKLKEFADIEQIVSEYSTEIAEPEFLSSIRLAAKAIDGLIFTGAGSTGSGSTEFSFIEIMKDSDKNFQNDNEGYDQVASTLYAALLSAGIEKYDITRLRHKLAVEYIKPGLDAWISGNGGDLKFRNTLQHKIAIFADVADNRLTISLAGSLRDKRYDLKVETIQKFSPPVVYLEDKNLKTGEKVVLSPGKDGLLVRVTRNSELISEDRYEAEKAIVQIGPGTVLSEEDK
ncbi:MAG: hypothetical protein FIA99_12315 [Ruminiclostridium sp.]|nr:hypothetical protein [Ruminiclostridium sp.]